MKYICLSFDDGPNILPGDNTMEQMLDILEKHKVPASFFLIGNKITEENTKIIKRAVSLGCDIQNHSWTHPFMHELTNEQIAEEYRKCDEAIIKITGKKPEFFRPPYVDVTENMYDVIKVPFICGRGCFDWEPDKDADFRYNLMLKLADSGTIYLLHVLEGNKATLEATDRIIPVLKEQGYTFVNLPDLFEKCNIDRNINHSLWTIANNDMKSNTWPYNQQQ
ncbi:MAG: polysaccharide deacetylase family protein [Treponema sp.]|nr:polysaccharide deacetylase family protein [Treponema sp.]